MTLKKVDFCIVCCQIESIQFNSCVYIWWYGMDDIYHQSRVSFGNSVTGAVVEQYSNFWGKHWDRFTGKESSGVHNSTFQTQLLESEVQ
jgi:hypothetical protein